MFFKILFKVISGIINAVILLALFIFFGGNLGKFIIYNEYYNMESNVCINPGLGDGFVPQDVAAYEAGGKLFVCGYMDDKSNSRVYVVDVQSNAYHYIKLTTNGDVFLGHTDGIATSGEDVYIVSDGRLHTCKVSSLLSSEDGGEVDIGAGVSLGIATSFIYCDDASIYIGEFHHTMEEYYREHEYDSGNGVTNGIITKYSLQSIRDYFEYQNATHLTAEVIYTVRDKVQGVCFTPDGRIVLSTSYHVKNSYFYVYNQADCINTGETIDGIPVYEFGEHTNVIKAPAMSEGLDWYDGKVITVYESACNKYLIGKPFFPDDVNALEIK
jgi:hypothetical protein